MDSSALTSPTNLTDGNRNFANGVDRSIELANNVVAIVKEVGEILNSIPYVKSLSGVILQIIKVREEIVANKQRCREIIDKILRMSKSIYEKLSKIAQSKQREKLSSLEGHLNEHERTLTAVYNSLVKHRSRSRFSRFINRGLDELNEHDRRLDELNTQLLLDIIFHITMEQASSAAIINQLGPSVPLSGADHILPPKPNLMKHEDFFTADQSTISNVPQYVLPPKPYFMVERETQFDISLNILLRAEPTRITILGGGGFGKTTLARSILHDPKIAERYKLRYFLSCEGMADVDTLLLGVGTMLGIKTTPSAILASVRHVLAPSTTLLCLDNFETPWEPSATRTKVEEMLASIADIPNLSLIITTRGTQRPSKVAWSHPLLPPLSTISVDSAHLILRAICPNHTLDVFTQQLLESVDGIPLAITLIANLLRDGETSHGLWTRWPKERTSIIENGGDDRESNLNASIALSVNSPRMKRDPDAIILLATLSLLPDGFSLSALDRLEENLRINDIHKLLKTLRAVALIKPNEINPSPRIQMLSPIRIFCTEFLSSEISAVLEKVVNYYVVFMLQAGYTNMDNSDLYNQVAPEIQNMHSIFQRAYKSGYSQDIIRLIDATTHLNSWSEYIGYLAQDTIKMALAESTNIPVRRADCLVSLGNLYHREGHHKRAEEFHREAAELFKQENHPMGRARASYNLGNVCWSMRQFDRAEGAYKESLEIWTQAGSKRGEASARWRLGSLYRTNEQYSEAEDYLTSALNAYEQISDRIGQANTTHDISRLHIFLGNLVEAEKFSTESMAVSKQANYAIGEANAIYQLGRLYLLTDRVAEARDAFKKAIMLHKQKSNPIGHLRAIDALGQAYIRSDQLSEAERLLMASVKVELDVIEVPYMLATLARVYIHGERLDKAEPHLDRALGLFQKFQDKDGEAIVLAHLATVYLETNRLNDAERVLKSIPNSGIWREFQMRKLWVLGEVYTVQGRLDSAEASWKSAMVWAKRYKSSHQQGSIFRCMGDLHMKRGQVGQAIENFMDALECHRKAQWVSEQSIDLRRLVEAHERSGKAQEAESMLKEAGRLMETIREARALM